MKKQLLSILMAVIGFAGFAQVIPVKSVFEIQTVSQQALLDCKDTVNFYNDTVYVVGIVMHDASEGALASSTVPGGRRPFVFICDTATGGTVEPFGCIEVMGTYRNAANQELPSTEIVNALAGDILKLKAVVRTFSNQTNPFLPTGTSQLNLVDNSSVTILGSTNVPNPVQIQVGDLNDQNSINILPTGEQWEGSYVSLQNVTVVNVVPFNGNRVSFDISDANGNLMNVSDRFWAQKLPNFSIGTQSGNFVAPPVGTVFSSLKGFILHSPNGCTGQTGRGYELNPSVAADYVIGVAPPVITNITRTPQVPTDAQSVLVKADISDFDGTITGATLSYSTNPTAPLTSFTTVPMTLVSGTTSEYQATIPANANGTLVRYVIRATDNANNTSTMPFTPASATTPNTYFYRVNNEGVTISAVQEVLNLTNDNSLYVGQTVTVKGVVTASAQEFDLGFVYIQEPTKTEWAGIAVVGNDIFNLKRGDEVTVTGLVQENFGFTRINASSAVPTGNKIVIDAIEVNPFDSAIIASKNMEKYESMVVRYKNPAAGGKIFISNAKENNFGDWRISTDTTANTIKSKRIKTGVVNANNSSSLYVSHCSDSAIAVSNNVLVPIIKTKKGMAFDYIEGVLGYEFSSYTLYPRNNFDVAGYASALDRPKPTAIQSFHNTTTNKIDAAWQDVVPGAASYTLQMDDNDVFTSPTVYNNILPVLTQTPCDVEGGMNYFRLKAINAAGEESDWSNMQIVIISSINEVNNNINVNIYPNPSTGLVFLQLEEVTETLVAELYDFKGALVNKTNINAQLSNINLSGLNKGIYNLRLVNANGETKSTRRIILN